MERRLEITWGSLWRVVIMVAAVGVAFAIREVIAVLLLAIVISSALDAPLNWLERQRVPRMAGIFFMLIAGISVVALLLYTIIPIAAIEVRDFADNMDRAGETLGVVLGMPHLSDAINAGLSSISSTFVPNLLSTAVLPQLFENLVMVTLTMVISIYLAWYRDGIESFLRAVLPLQYEHYAVSVLHRARKKIGRWLEGQLILTAIVALVVFFGLALLGVNYALILALLAGVLEIIPFVGPIVAGTLAFLVGVSQSMTIGIAAAVLFFVIHQLEAHIMMPLVMRKTTGIHPVIVALSIVAGYQVAGFVGLILAIPFVVVIQELVEDFVERKHRQPAL